MNISTDFMSVTHAEDKEEKSVITKDYLEKHFKHHDRLIIYQGKIPLTITKEWHLHFDGGHHEFDITDCEDLAELCSKRNITLQPADTEMI